MWPQPDQLVLKSLRKCHKSVNFAIPMDYFQKFSFLCVQEIVFSMCHVCIHLLLVSYNPLTSYLLQGQVNLKSLSMLHISCNSDRMNQIFVLESISQMCLTDGVCETLESSMWHHSHRILGYSKRLRNLSWCVGCVWKCKQLCLSYFGNCFDSVSEI